MIVLLMDFSNGIDQYTSLMFLNAGKLKKTVEDGTQGKGKGKVVGI